jgi:membrane fusion protein, multidrug efflux system
MTVQSTTVGAGAGAPAAAVARAGGAGDAPELKKKLPVSFIALGVVVVGALGTGGRYVAQAGLESTDDAQVEADIVAVPSLTSGLVTRVLFAENQVVSAGDLLVEIDPAPATARLAQAEAELTSARAAAEAASAQVSIVEATARGQKSAADASLQGASVGAAASGDEIQQATARVAAATAARAQAQSDLDRTRTLFMSAALPKQQLDAAQTAFDTAEANLAEARARQAYVGAVRVQAYSRIQEARARVGQASAVEAQIQEAHARAAQAQARIETAKATRDLAALELSYTKIVAPRAGIASKRTAVVGQMIGAGQPVAQIVPVNDVWVTANFKETQLSKMRPGQRATVEVDAFPGLELRGVVDSVSGATGARFSLLPPENATGNFTKVVQRVPVRVRLESAPGTNALRVGMSADVTVDTRK